MQTVNVAALVYYILQRKVQVSVTARGMKDRLPSHIAILPVSYTPLLTLNASSIDVIVHSQYQRKSVICFEQRAE